MADQLEKIYVFNPKDPDKVPIRLLTMLVVGLLRGFNIGYKPEMYDHLPEDEKQHFQELEVKPKSSIIKPNSGNIIT